MERRFLGFLLLALWVFNYSFTVSGNSEGDALVKLKNALIDPNSALSSWNGSLVNPCTWYHITCNDDNSVTRVDLGNASLSGELVPELALLPNLQYLEIFNNNISGKIPPELGNLTNLVSLDLYQNKLSGPMPDTLGKLWKLRFLRLNNNTLSGAIPYSLTNVYSLQVLDLSNNNLSGFIPENGSFALFSPASFRNNPKLILPPLPTPNPPSYNPRAKGRFKAAVAVGAAFFFCFVFTLCSGVPTLAWWRRLIRRQDPFIDLSAEEEHKTLHLEQLIKFSLRELMFATHNFNRKNVLGRGGFGKVYKGRLADGSLVAVKRLKEERTQSGELQFQTELEMISMAVHCNILRLKGFCMTPTERLLVYPYMPNGSVASCLRERKESQPPLDWPKRKRIALGSARGITYLHEQCNPKIIHRDIKAANILLDEEFEAVVGDFGLAKLMDYQDTHIITAVCGTFGHIAPEYLSMGKSSEKSDVFAYGVMLLELLTGQQAFNLARLADNDESMLLNWVKGFLKDNKLELLVDKELQGNCTQEEVEELIKIALLCTQSSPMERPKMSEVVRMLEGEGLADKWQVLQKDTDVFRLELSHAHLPNGHNILDYKFNPAPDELSGPR